MTKGYMGSDTNGLRRLLKTKYSTYFDFSDALAAFAWDTLYEFPAVTTDETSKVLSLTLYIRIIKCFSSCYILIQNGLWEDAKVVIRTGVLALLRLRAIFLDPEFSEKYILYDHINRRKIIKPNLQKGGSILNKDVIAEFNRIYQELGKQVSEIESRNDKNYFGELKEEYELAKKVGELPLYNSAYALFSLDAHVGPRSIQDILKFEPSVFVNWEPDYKDVALVLSIASQIMIAAISTMYEQMKMDVRKLNPIKDQFVKTFPSEKL